jgi:catechol 2,3-dioxygenase-like lactoylglutathione lyase family enzyme
MSPVPILRVARPTDDIEALRQFYVDGLGFEVLGAFADHDGFDGLMLGRHDWPYHLEFTHRRGHQVGTSPGNENLLVFYYPQKELWTQAVERMLAAGFQSVAPDNPYWARQGRTFADPDGYRVVLQAGASPYGVGE